MIKAPRCSELVFNPASFTRVSLRDVTIAVVLGTPIDVIYAFLPRIRPLFLCKGYLVSMLENASDDVPVNWMQYSK